MFLRKGFVVAPSDLVFVFIICVVLFLNTLFLSRVSTNKIVSNKKCYLHDGRNPNATGKLISYFEDLLTSIKQPAYDNGIFFIESKCSQNGIAVMKPRYACSIESVARLHPERDVFVVFASPVGLPMSESEWSTSIAALLKYRNIHFRNVQLQQLCLGTPLEDWINSSDDLFNSTAVTEHVSDITRNLLLYKYGGTYADQDFVILKHFDTLGRNWITIQNQLDDGNWKLANALLDFTHRGSGHALLREVLSEIARTYSFNLWGYNGSDAFERILYQVCNTTSFQNTTRAQCKGIKLYPPEMFYPLYGGDESQKYFMPSNTKEVLERIKNVTAFHYWNSVMKSQTNITMRDGDAYDIIAQKHCSLVYKEHKEFK